MRTGALAKMPNLPNMLVAFMVFVLLMPASAFGITLDESLSAALDASPRARAAESEAQARRAGARAQTAFILPQVSLNAGYHRTGTTAEDTLFITYPDDIYMADLTASQVIWSGGRVLGAWKLRRELYERATLGATSARREIKLRVRLSYYGVLYARALLGVQEARVAQRVEELADAQDLRAAGMVTSLDVRQAELGLSMARDTLRAAEAEAEVALIDFNLSLGVSGGELRSPEGELEPAPGLREQLVRAGEALSNGSILDIRAASSGLRARKNERAIAIGGYFPSLAAVGSLKTERNFFSGEYDRSWSAGLLLTWDIFNGGLTRAEAAEAKARLALAEEGLADLRHELTGALGALRARAASASDRIKLSRDAVTLAGLNYADARGHYRAGTITQTRLGDFGLALTEARFGLMGLYYQEQELTARTQALLEGAGLE